MRYSTDNMLISLNRNLSDALRAFGYDIRWQATGNIEGQTSGAAQSKGTITLVPDFPAEPTYIVRLNDGSSPSAEEIAVPAFSLRVSDGPRKRSRLGIGSLEFERERAFQIDGFAYDEFQQRELMDFFYDWLDEGNKRLPILDYSLDAASPTPLPSVDVWRAYVEKEELIHEVQAIRYYVKVTGIVRYVE